MKKRFLLYWFYCITILTLFETRTSAQGCDLKVDAGPDTYYCDPSKPRQLDGMINSNYPPAFQWIPAFGLDNLGSLNPNIISPPGKYKYKLSANSVSGNLIVNGDFEAGNTGFTSDYNYVQFPINSLFPKSYGISDNPMPYDSTYPYCPGNGNFMIAKSATAPGDIVWSQTIACNPGENFIFRFRAERFYKVHPRGGSAIVTLQAEVDGLVLGTTGYIPRCKWVEFAATFISKTSNLNLIIREIAGTGTGFGLDDISLIEKCTAEDEVEIEIVDLKSKIALRPNPICGSQEFFLDGSASLNNPNVKYYWSTDKGHIIQILGKSVFAKGNGTYTLKVIYDDGFAHCEDETEVVIDVTENLEGQLDIYGKPNCHKDSFLLSGAALNGTGSYNYIWSPANKILQGQGTPNAKANSPGIYSLRIIDKSTKCEFITSEEVRGDSSLPRVSITGDTLINCLKNNVLLESFPNDTSSFEWVWISPDQKQYKNQSKMSFDIPGLVTLVVKDLKSKCQDSAFWNINEDRLLPKIELGNDLVLDCKNSEFNVVATQEYQNGQFVYHWTLPNGSTKIDSQLRDKQIIEAGKVVLNVVNLSNNCEAIDSLWISDIRSTPKINLGISDGLTCYNPQININATISANNQLIKWSTINGNILNGLTTNTIQVNSPGTYYIEVIDTINHCSITDSIEIFDYRTQPIIDIKSDTVFYCKDTEKSIDASGSSKMPDLKYIWTGNGIITSGLGTDKITVSTAGIYILTIIDTVTGCSDKKTITINPDLNSPVASISNPETLNCKITSIQLRATASSGSGNPLKYSWSSPQNFPIGNSNGPNPTISNPGNYILTIEDQINGCTNTTSVIVAIDTLSPEASISIPELLNCKITSIQLSAQASSTTNNPLKYNWSSPQNFSIGNPNTLNPIISNPGNYILTIEDQINGCASSTSVKINIDTLTPVIDLGKNLIWNCATTDLKLDVLNNTQGLNYSYQWSSNNGIISGNSNQKTIIAGSPGNYKLTVINQTNFCSSNSDIQIIEDKAIPLAIGSSTDILSCIKKSAVLESNGSSAGGTISYVWKEMNGQIISNTQNVTVTKIGKYILEVTDQTNKCTKSDTLEVIENIQNPLIDAGQPQELTCKQIEVILNANITIPKTNYSIIWNTINGSIVNGSNGLNPKVNREGDYVITVTDLTNGCTSTDVVAISKDNNVPAKIDFSVDQPKCITDHGLISILHITGGKPNYIYFVDGKQVDILTPIDATIGKHQITVVDENGCKLSNDLIVINPNSISINLKPEVVLFHGDKLELKPLYSIPIDSIISFNWSPAEYLDCFQCPFPNIIGLNNDNVYTVTIIDKNGCEAIASIRIRIDERGIWTPNVFSPNGDGINDSFYPVVKEDSYKEIRWMRIYDRWGECVFTNQNFQPNNPVNGWSGKFKSEPLNPGVYVWILEIEWKNGDVEQLKGDVTIIR